MSSAYSSTSEPIPVSPLFRAPSTKDAFKVGMLAAFISTAAVTVDAHTEKVEATSARSKLESVARFAGVRRETKQQIAISRIETLSRNQDGWKGPGTLGPTEASVKAARRIAATILDDERVGLPHIGLAADGEINFYWKTPRVVVDLSIASDGTYSLFAQPQTGEPIYHDAPEPNTPLPKELVRLLQSKG